MKYPQDYVNKILCGDCLEIMKGIPDKAVDLVLTDPPYGIGMDKGFGGSRKFGSVGLNGGFGDPIPRRQYKQTWDKERPSKIYFDEIQRISKICMIFGGNFFADILPQGKHWIVWDKLNTMPTFGDCELIWTNIDRQSVKKITQEYNGLLGKEDLRVHPTQKPLELIRKILLTYSQPKQIICDPFIGSGTTAVCCKELGRDFIGIEKMQEYVEIAQRRLAQEYLFA